MGVCEKINLKFAKKKNILFLYKSTAILLFRLYIIDYTFCVYIKLLQRFSVRPYIGLPVHLCATFKSKTNLKF